VKRSDGLRAHIKRQNNFCVVDLTDEATDNDCAGEDLGEVVQNGTGNSGCITAINGACGLVASSNNNGGCTVFFSSDENCQDDVENFDCGAEGDSYAIDFDSVDIQCT